MNKSLLDVKGAALVVSQFTLYGDARGQRRPSFIAAARPEQAVALYEEFCGVLRQPWSRGADRRFSDDDVGRIGERRSGDDFAGFG